MGVNRRLGLGIAIASLGGAIVACSAPGDGDDAVGRSAQALGSDGGECREISLEAWRRPGASCSHDDERTLSPPMRFEVPSEIPLFDTKNKGAHWIAFGWHVPGGGDASCRYKGGGNLPTNRALVQSCAPSTVHAGDLVTADEVTLAIDNGNQVRARVTLREAPPCGADAGAEGGTSDGGGADGGGVGDAASDAPSCTPSTCVGSACVTATCTPSGCVQSNVADGTSCPTGDACATGACSAGACVATPIVLPPPPPCHTVTCVPPTIGVVTTPVADGTACNADGNACTENDQCIGGACVPGSPRTCTPSGPCAASTCNPASGCQETFLAAGTSCDPAPNVCAGVRACDGAGRCVQGVGLTCSSNDPCIIDGCSPTSGCTRTAIAGCDSTPVGTDEPFETRASLTGNVVSSAGAPIAGATFTVFDERVTGAPRSDVVVTQGTGGAFRVKLTSFPTSEPDRSPPRRLVVLVDSPSTLRAYRVAYVHPGDSVDLGVIRLLSRDPLVTNVGPEGGVARDSNGLVEMVIPPGALATTIPVRITPILTRDDFTAPLPPNSLTGYGWDAEPSGTTFAVPVTVRVSNYRNFPTAVPIPIGSYDEVNARWTGGSVATWDGSRFAGAIRHFSPGDVNFNDEGELLLLIANGGNPNKGGPNGGVCGASKWQAGGGSIENVWPLPGTRARSEELSFSLHYSSGLAGPRKITPKRGTSTSEPPASLPPTTLAVTVPGTVVSSVCVSRGESGGATNAPGTCTGSGGSCGSGAASFAGAIEMIAARNRQTMTAEQNAKDNAFGGWVSLPLGESGAVPAPGLVTQTFTLNMTASSGMSCGGSGSFAVSDPLAPRQLVVTEAGPTLQATRKVLLHHRFTSSFGAGWAIREMSRLFASGDHAVLVNGEGLEEEFRPRARLTSLPDPTGEQVFARDAQTGEIFVASAPGTISSLDPITGARTAVATGLAFPSEPYHALAVAQVGGARRFVVAFRSGVIEVGAGGAQRPIATRAFFGNSAYSQSAVAAWGDKVFYTVGDTSRPVLYRIDLAQASPAPVPVSSETGDESLFPEAALGGVTFGHPLGLAFGAGGVLYIADGRRHAVYGVFPDLTGAISASSGVELVMGNGGARQIMPPGEAQPALAYTINQPMRLSMSEDGRLLVMNGNGVASFDPQAREAETLVLDRGLDEILPSLAGLVGGNPPTPLSPASFVALSRTSFFTRTGNEGTMRVDVDLLSSELDPTRTVVKNGAVLELTDRNAGMIWRYDATSGRLLEQKKRTGEVDFTVSYRDARSDAIDRITNAVGGQWVFGYAAGKITSITDPAGGLTTFQVNGQGDLASFTEPDGEGHSFLYDTHHMTSKRTSRGDVTTYDFAPDGTVSASHKPGGEDWAFDPVNVVAASYDATGGVVRTGGYTDGHGVHHALVLDTLGQIDSDTFTADGVERTIAAVHPAVLVGRDEPFVARRNNRIQRTSHRTLNGVNLAPPVEHDSSGRPVFQLPTGGGSASILHRWVYRDDGWLVESLDGPSTNAQRYDRDAAGHVTRIFDIAPGSGNAPTGRETSFTWRPDGQPLTMTTHGVTTTFSYDDAGGSRNLAGSVDTLGRTMTMTYDGRGNVSAVTDGTALSSFVYDTNNRLRESHDGLNNATTLRYTHAGCGCTESDLVTGIHTPDLPAGVEWTMAYGAQGRLVSVTDPHGFTERYAYLATGELASVEDRLTRTTSMTHDALGRVATILDTLGRTHARSYTVPTATGWSGPTLTAASASATPAPASLSAALGSGDYQIGLNAFQAEGYPAQISFYRDATFALGYTSTFDAAARLTTRVDRTTHAFDSNVVPSTLDAGTVTRELLQYDPRTPAPLLSLLESPRPPAGADGLSLTRDLELDVTSAQGFGGGIESPARYLYTRDTGGRVTARANRFSTASRASEPISQATFDALPATYTYRPDGRLSSVTNIDGASGNSELTIIPFNSTRTFSANGGLHSFTYDARGLLATQTDYDGTYRYFYDEVGRNTRLEFPDGHARVQLFDDLGRITSRCYRYADAALDRCYGAEYDPVGNPVRLVDPEGSDELAYDALDRLTKLTRKTPAGAVASVEDYAYNALGALRVHASAAVDHQRPRLAGGGLADAAVPATFNATPVNLDLGGRITLLDGNALGWDMHGQHRRVDPPMPLAPMFFDFDPMGRRAFTIGTAALRGSREFYLYEGVDRIAAVDPTEEFPNGATSLMTFLFDGVDHPLRAGASVTETNTQPPFPAPPQTVTTSLAPAVIGYYELDLAGNVRRIRARGGADLGGYRYSAFGKTLENTVVAGPTPASLLGAPDQPLRWKGMWRFDVNGVELYDARARLWSPALGTFLSIDEYAFHSPRTTLWSWPTQSPFRFRDPSGRWGDDSRAPQNWGPYAVQHLDDPVMVGLGAAGAVAYGGLAAPGVAPFVSTSAGISLWGTLSEMGPAGVFIAGVLSGTAPAVVGSGAGQTSLPGQMTGDAALAGQCVEKTNQSIATFGGTPISTLPSWSHWANQLPSGMIHDPTLRANLVMEGAYVGDVAVGQTMFTAAEWASLVARVGR